MRSRTLLLSLALPAAALLAGGDAHADVTSWLAFGSGYALQTNTVASPSTRDSAPALTYSLGVGSTPLAPFVVGILYRGVTMLGLGTDVGASLRLATGGFARGGWGLALDGGVLWRSWRNGDYGRWPIDGMLTFGMPWGFQVGVGAQVANVDGGTTALGGYALLEIDLMRLTVMRQGPSELWWPNPNPAGGHEKQVSLLAW
ncbi:MAG TPA: hypothetical protein VIF15_02385 [Polyangiaceae bacterium]